MAQNLGNNVTIQSIYTFDTAKILEATNDDGETFNTLTDYHIVANESLVLATSGWGFVCQNEDSHLIFEAPSITLTGQFSILTGRNNVTFKNAIVSIDDGLINTSNSDYRGPLIFDNSALRISSNLIGKVLFPNSYGVGIQGNIPLIIDRNVPTGSSFIINSQENEAVFTAEGWQIDSHPVLDSSRHTAYTLTKLNQEIATIKTKDGYSHPLRDDVARSTYIHEQGVASAVWTVQHNLNKYPSVTVVDSSDNVIVADIEYIDTNTVRISMVGASKGRAYLN